MAGSASPIPASARVLGCSPNSSPASTEKPADATALSGPATLNAACRKPRYSAIAPVTPPSPAAAAQATDGQDGNWLLTHGATSSRASTLAASARIVTRMTLAARVARPAA